jgi:hypothetical protein
MSYKQHLIATGSNKLLVQYAPGESHETKSQLISGDVTEVAIFIYHMERGI